MQLSSFRGYSSNPASALAKYQKRDVETKLQALFYKVESMQASIKSKKKLSDDLHFENSDLAAKLSELTLKSEESEKEVEAVQAIISHQEGIQTDLQQNLKLVNERRALVEQFMADSEADVADAQLELRNRRFEIRNDLHEMADRLEKMVNGIPSNLSAEDNGPKDPIEDKQREDEMNKLTGLQDQLQAQEQEVKEELEKLVQEEKEENELPVQVDDPTAEGADLALDENACVQEASSEGEDDDVEGPSLEQIYDALTQYKLQQIPGWIESFAADITALNSVSSPCADCGGDIKAGFLGTLQVAKKMGEKWLATLHDGHFNLPSPRSPKPQSK